MTLEAEGKLFGKTDFTVFGISHQEVGAELRQHFALSTELQEELLQEIKTQTIPFGMILSTCNRTEIYIESSSSDWIKEKYLELISGDAKVFNDEAYMHKGKAAVDHAFAVAAGLKSQIPGDFEIIGQMRKAFNQSKEVFDSSAFFERLMNTITQVSKRVKNETEFSSGVTSTAYAAVKSIRDEFPKVSNERLLIYGTGKIGKNVCQNLVKHIPAKNIDIVNRSIEKAELLAEKYDLNCHAESQLASLVKNADVIVVATGADQPTLTADLLSSDSDKIIIDLSIPRNVAPELYETNRVIDVDELSEKNNETLNLRIKEISKVEAIVDEDKTKFFEWMENRKFAPTMSAIKAKFEEVKKREFVKATKTKDVFDRDEVETLTNDIIKKFARSLYPKIQNLKTEELDLVHQLFDVKEK